MDIIDDIIKSVIRQIASISVVLPVARIVGFFVLAGLFVSLCDLARVLQLPILPEVLGGIGAVLSFFAGFSLGRLVNSRGT